MLKVYGPDHVLEQLILFQLIFPAFHVFEQLFSLRFTLPAFHVFDFFSLVDYSRYQYYREIFSFSPFQKYLIPVIDFLQLKSFLLFLAF